MAELRLTIGQPMQTIELSHPMVRGMPNHSSHPAFDLVPYYRHGDFSLEGGYGGSNELLLLSGHSGTHLDALGHVTRDGVGQGGLSSQQLQAGIDGLAHHGIETVQPIIRRGVLVDVVRHRGGPVDATAAVTAAEIAEICAVQNTPLAAGDCVLIHTGWSRNWGNPALYMGEPHGTPGIDVEAADYLCDAGAFLIGGESAVVEHQAAGVHTLPVHMRVLAERGVHLLENMNLSQIAATGVTEFTFLCLPLLLAGATGSPVRAVAVIQ